MPSDEVRLDLSGSITGGGASGENRPPGAGPPTQPAQRGSAGRGAGPVLRPRVLVRGDVTFEPPRDPPSTAADLTHGWETAPDEEPAARGFKVGPSWQPLLKPLSSLIEDWPGPPSLIYVENLVGTERQVRPSAAEVASEEAHVIELGVSTGGCDVSTFALVRPARAMYLEPALTTYVRCQAGPAKARVVALPPTYVPPPVEGEGDVNG